MFSAITTQHFEPSILFDGAARRPQAARGAGRGLRAELPPIEARKGLGRLAWRWPSDGGYPEYPW
jgi:hypothetical protein